MVDLRCLCVLMCVMLLVPPIGGNAFAQNSTGEPEPSVSFECPRIVRAGVAYRLRIIIIDGAIDGRPELPAAPGLQIAWEGATGVTRHTSVINGRVTRENRQEAYIRVIVREPGVVTMPRFSIDVDGQEFSVKPFEITALADEQLFTAEINVADTEVYVGQPIAASLRLHVVPPINDRGEVIRSWAEMWYQIDRRASTWGMFTTPPPNTERIEQRTFENGTTANVYVYELSEKFWPGASRSLDRSDVRIVLEYPTQGGRDLFGDYRVTATRPLTVTPTMPAVTVREIPKAQQPEGFNGAIGQFRIEAEARPLDVAVGDPITLRMTILDETPGGARLEGIRPPEIHAQDELTRDFRVPEERLSGETIGRRRSFVQTIRPRRDDIEAIPPIRFAYFDTLHGQYTVTESDPIPIRVRPAATVGMDEVVAASSNDTSHTTELTRVAGGLVANYAGDDILAVTHRFTPGLATIGGLLAPPAVFASAMFVRRRREQHERSPAIRRRRRALARARERLQANATNAARNDVATTVATALTGYIADRSGHPGETMTRAEAIDVLDRHDVDVSVREQIDGVLRDCETAQYAGIVGTAADDLRAAASRALDDLARTERDW